MEILCSAGIRFSLDDFGTGHATRTDKIDQSFICDITTDASDEVIVRTIIVMCNAPGMEVIAEVVETEQQRAFLVRNGCYTYQAICLDNLCQLRSFRI